jgi:DNA-binding transcriptional MerR regulator
MKMQELEERTGVNRETIRVYLRHGLIPEPERPKPNVAIYNEKHVESILTVRHLQKEKRLTLPLIKRALEEENFSLPTGASNAYLHLDKLLASRAGIEERLIPVAKLEPTNPFAESDAQALSEIGAVTLIKRKGKLYLSSVDAQLVGIWAKMRDAGFTEEVGFSPSVCKMYVETGQNLAHKEVEIFLRTVSGKKTEDSAADMVQFALSVMIEFVSLVRLKTALKDMSPQNIEKLQS